MSSEVISKLYLELSQLVPADTKTNRELELEGRVKALEEEREAAIEALREYGSTGGGDHLEYQIRSVIDQVQEDSDDE
ncbi:MAG: hypothetical protein AAGG01_24310 [Planctomycetota bacterium]